MVKGDGDRQPTKEQMRLAEITQGSGLDEDRVLTKLVKKVIELTRCSQVVAEGALFDNDNNVEQAVMQILDKSGTDWETQQKGRKTKKSEAEEAKDQRSYGRGRGGNAGGGKGPGGKPRGPAPSRNGPDSRPPRERNSENNQRGGDRGDRPPRGPRFGTENRGDRKPKDGGFKEWKASDKSDPTVSVFNDNEDTTWSNSSGPLVFNRREPAPTTTSATDSGGATKMSWAAMAAKEKSAAQPASSEPAKTEDFSAPASGFASFGDQDGPTQKPVSPGENGEHHDDGYQRGPPRNGGSNWKSSRDRPDGNRGASSAVGSGRGFGRNDRSSDSKGREEKPTSSAPEFVNSSLQSQQHVYEPPKADAVQDGPKTMSWASIAAKKKSAAPPPAPAQPAPEPATTFTPSPQKETSPQKPPSGYSASTSLHEASPETSLDAQQVYAESKPVSTSTTATFTASAPADQALTDQLKNDLRLTSSITVSTVTQPASELLSFATSPLDTTAQHSSDATAFKKSVDSFTREAPAAAADSWRDNGDVNESSFFNNTARTQNVAPLKHMEADLLQTQNTDNSQASQYQSSHAQQSRPVTGLSFDTTSSISVDPIRNNGSQPTPVSTQAQSASATAATTAQQPAHSFYAQFPYSQYAFPFMNMSPVTGLRDDAQQQQYATNMLSQYAFPFMNMDMTSLAAMIPPLGAPSAAPSTAPPQAPPQVQSQHHQPTRDAYADMKNYQSGASSGLGSSASHLTSSSTLSQQSNQQQQRQQASDAQSLGSSSVAPPPGFSGPPSNLTTAFMPQGLSSLFHQGYNAAPQFPMNYMGMGMPSNQHRPPQHMFATQTAEDQMSSAFNSGHQQQKMYGSGQQQSHDKYGQSASSVRDRMNAANANPQHTPPPMSAFGGQGIYGSGVNTQRNKPYSGHQWNS
ncbi:UBA/TS-N domain containing protein [Aphelenchoides avenae]|nr:UBA/TS-N domain containing protein [Aphelenchus avenae]